MRLEYLNEFIVLVEQCNFRCAADLLFMSEATLSKHIAALEQALGVPLLIRATRPIRMTSEGERLLVTARTICAQWETYTASVERCAQSAAKLVVAHFQNPDRYGLDEAFARFSASNPAFKLHTYNAENADIEKLLLENKCDIGIIKRYDEPSRRVNHLTFMTDRLAVILPDQHRLAQRDAVQITELKDENILLIPQKSITSQACMRLFNENGITPHIVSRIDNSTSIFRMVSKGVGISLYSRHSAGLRIPENVRMVDLTPPVMCHIDVIYRKARPLPPAVNAMLTVFHRKHNT